MYRAFIFVDTFKASCSLFNSSLSFNGIPLKLSEKLNNEHYDVNVSTKIKKALYIYM